MEPIRLDETAQGAETPPGSVAIVAMGLSNVDYLLTCGTNGSRKYFDEVWGINVISDIVQCDRGFMMDPLAFFEADPRTEKHLSANYKEWLSRCKIPIYSSIADPEFPCLVEYPLEAVINSVRSSYFSNTVAYALAYAIHLGVKRIFLFGCDYNYGPGSRAYEDGRACVEFYVGIAGERGIEVNVASNSSLLDTNKKSRDKMYGYPFELDIVPDEQNPTKVKVVKHMDKPIAYK